MKKLFILAAAIVAFASCSKNEPQAIVETREICFATTALETRANDVTPVTTKTLKEFAVWGYIMADNTAPADVQDIFTATEVRTTDGTTTESSIFEAAGADVKYWAASTDYMFSAMSPISEKAKYNYSFNTTNSAFEQKITGFEIKADETTPDLIVARPASAEVEANKYTHAAVGLIFDHMLSRVKFTFTNKFADDNVTIEISNVTLNDVLAKGDATITSTGVATWTPNGDGTIDAVYGTENEIVANAAQNEVKETVYRYIIPQTATYTVSFDLVVKADGQTVLTKSYKDVSLANTAFVNGKGYVFNANISGDLLEEELHPIQFTVKVTEWVDNDPVDINLTGK